MRVGVVKAFWISLCFLAFHVNSTFLIPGVGLLHICFACRSLRTPWPDPLCRYNKGWGQNGKMSCFRVVAINDCDGSLSLDRGFALQSLQFNVFIFWPYIFLIQYINGTKEWLIRFVTNCRYAMLFFAIHFLQKLTSAYYWTVKQMWAESRYTNWL